MHKCPKDTCTEFLPRHILACKKHWFSLPRQLRNEILVAWKAYVLGDAEEYLAVRKRAEECLNH